MNEQKLGLPKPTTYFRFVYPDIGYVNFENSTSNFSFKMILEAVSKVVKDLALPYSIKKIKLSIYLPYKRVISDIYSLLIDNIFLTIIPLLNTLKELSPSWDTLIKSLKKCT